MVFIWVNRHDRKSVSASDLRRRRRRRRRGQRDGRAHQATGSLDTTTRRRRRDWRLWRVVRPQGGLRDPVLVAANDGVGTKVKIAIESGILDTIGVDLVAMCVNDIVVQGAEPLFFLDYFATAKLDPAIGAAIVAGIARGLRRIGLRPDRRRNCGNAGPLRQGRFRPRRLRGRRR